MCDDGDPEHHLTLTEQQFAAQQRLIISWDSYQPKVLRVGIGKEVLMRY